MAGHHRRPFCIVVAHHVTFIAHIYVYSINRILASIVILGKACDLIDHHQQTKKSSASSPQKTSTPETATTSPPKKAAEDSDEDTDDSSMTTPSAESAAKAEDKAFSDISLLESKLQSIDPTLPIRGNPPPTSIISEEDEENLSPIEEDITEEPKHRKKWPQNDSFSSSTEASNLEPNHRWSNRRSQLLKHQGELNRVVFSDSRRRPLSCTPPSTSISTSVSIDDDEPIFSPLEVNNIVEILSGGEDVTPQSDELVVPVMEATDDLVSELSPMTIRPKSLSSPDFMKSFRAAYDAERDWPLVDEDSLDEDEEDQEQVVVLDSVDSLKSHDVLVSRQLELRRGSSEDRFHRRKRFDTDRV
jgi:hypothetical protein